MIGGGAVTGLCEQHLATLGGDAPVEWGHDAEYLLRSTGYVSGARALTPTSVDVSLAAALAGRRSQSSFAGSSMRYDDLATLIVTALGCPDGSGDLSAAGPTGRAYPSGGALYPIEVVVYPLRVEALACRPWYYQPLADILVPFASADAVEIAGMFANEEVDRCAALVLLWADFGRPPLGKYAGKEYRLLLLEAGHAMQNVVLVAAALGLPALPLCGFSDAALAAAVGLDFPSQSVVYAVALGGRP